jgi:esterase
MKLFVRELGAGQPIVIMHGIFGSSDNWLTQSKILAGKYRVLSLDLRNHGQSGHMDEFDYRSMVGDLSEFVDGNQLIDPIVIGHSMGGKVAMNFAIAHPQKLQKLIVVDIAPKAYDLEHYVILDGLKAIPIEKITSRNEAEEALKPFVPESDVRQFLLKNLQRKPEGGFRWKLNLPVIGKNLRNIGLDLQFLGKFEKPTLFIRGARSRYIGEDDTARIRDIFPRAEIKTLDTGHWVQAEKPQEFVELVSNWLAAN